MGLVQGEDRVDTFQISLQEAKQTDQGLQAPRALERTVRYSVEYVRHVYTSSYIILIYIHICIYMYIPPLQNLPFIRLLMRIL